MGEAGPEPVDLSVHHPAFTPLPSQRLTSRTLCIDWAPSFLNQACNCELPNAGDKRVTGAEQHPRLYDRKLHPKPLMQTAGATLPTTARLWVHGLGFVALVYGSDHARGKPGSGSLCWPWALARPKGPETQRDSLPSPSKEVADPWSIIRYVLFVQQPVQMTGASGSRNTEGKRWSKEVSRVTWCLRCESNACYSVGETRQLRRDI